MSRIIFPLDEMSMGRAAMWYEELLVHVAYFKVGLEMWSYVGPGIFQIIPPEKVMLDLKLHDIPTTMDRAARRAFSHKVPLLTVHASAGVDAMKQCVKVADMWESNIVAVTLLTSQHFDEYRFKQLVDEALEAGVRRFVCSPKKEEVQYIKSSAGRSKVAVITPGISLSGKERDDQKRVCTPAQAVENGSDYLVIGRPIRDSDNPYKTASKILDEVGIE